MLTPPISDELRAVLAALPPGREIFLVNDSGWSFASTAAFGNKFRDWCKDAKLVGRSAQAAQQQLAANRIVPPISAGAESGTKNGLKSLSENNFPEVMVPGTSSPNLFNNLIFNTYFKFDLSWGQHQGQHVRLIGENTANSVPE